jgi:dCTP deaminase
MVLSDRTIKEEIAKGRILIEPLDPSCIQPASVDVHLDKNLLVFKTRGNPFYIDVKQNMEDLTELVEIGEDKPFFLQPGEFVLVSTLESITLPDDIVGRLEGKSSLGRIGLLIHSTAGYVDPGWKGHLTLELSNVAKLPVTLYYKMRIAQISFLRLTSAAERPYGSEGLGSKYQGQNETTASRYYQNF